jgi:hypothetical protein
LRIFYEDIFTRVGAFEIEPILRFLINKHVVYSKPDPKLHSGADQQIMAVGSPSDVNTDFCGLLAGPNITNRKLG